VDEGPHVPRRLNGKIRLFFREMISTAKIPVIGLAVMLFFGGVFAMPAYAGTAGPLHCGTQVEVDGAGTVAWDNETHGCASSDSYASSDVPNGSTSETLRLTNFGFAVPADQVITGITVAIERQSNATVADAKVQLVLNGVNIGEDKATDNGDWPTTDTVATFGGSTDDWTATLTEVDVNDVDFGIDIVCTRTAGATNRCYVDDVQITIEYADAPEVFPADGMTEREGLVFGGALFVSLSYFFWEIARGFKNAFV